jgi:N utilization substance protein B
MSHAEKELMFSLSKAYDLYNMLLMLIVAVNKEMRKKLEILSNRAEREGTQPPSFKFVDNRFALQLEENHMLAAFKESSKMSWDDDTEFVRKLVKNIEQSQVYQDYMEEEEDNYEIDREVWRKLYKMFIQENDELDGILEEKSLYWNDDKEVVDTFVLKTIKRFNPKAAGKQELLPEYKDEEDKDFASKLFRSTILKADIYQKYMSDASLIYFW